VRTPRAWDGDNHGQTEDFQPHAVGGTPRRVCVRAHEPHVRHCCMPYFSPTASVHGGRGGRKRPLLSGIASKGSTMTFRRSAIAAIMLGGSLTGSLAADPSGTLLTADHPATPRTPDRG